MHGSRRRSVPARGLTMASGCAAVAEEEEDAVTAEPPGGPREPCTVAVGCSWPCVPPDGLSRALCLRGDAGGGEAR